MTDAWRCPVDDDGQERRRTEGGHGGKAPGDEVLDDWDVDEGRPGDPIAQRDDRYTESERAEEPQPTIATPDDETGRQNHQQPDARGTRGRAAAPR